MANNSERYKAKECVEPDEVEQDDDVDQEEPPKSLAELEKKLKDAQDEAERLADRQAESKLSQDTLKKGIAVVGKNVEDYAKDDGEQLKLHKDLTTKISDTQKCLEGKYTADKVKAVFARIRTKVLDQETGLPEATVKAEALIAGPSEITSRNAKRAEAISQSQFDSLTMKGLKERNTQVQTFVNESGKAVDPNEAIALLWLANDRQTQTRHVFETVVVVDPFVFPKDATQHVEWLLGAHWKLLEDSVAALKAADTFANAKSNYELLLKTLAASVGSFKADVIAAAMKPDAASQYETADDEKKKKAT